jgi:hypothetical protein
MYSVFQPVTFVYVVKRYVLQCVLLLITFICYLSPISFYIKCMLCGIWFSWGGSNSANSSENSIGNCNCNSKQNNHHWWDMGVLWWFFWPCFEFSSFLILSLLLLQTFIFCLFHLVRHQIYIMWRLIVEVAQMLWISQAAASIWINQVWCG